MDIDVMNNGLCKVCGEQAAGFHFGAFTCEGCKSFFGRTYNNMSSISECKNNSECVIDKKNRTSCKACRLKKCLMVGMSKSGSRYGRRSNWFKIHCMIQEQGAASGQMQTQMKWDEDNNNVKKDPPLWALPPHIPGMSLFGYVPPLTPFFLPRGLPLPPHPPPPLTPPHLAVPSPPQLPVRPPPVPVAVSLPAPPTPHAPVDPTEILRRLGPEQDTPMDLRLRKSSPQHSPLTVIATRSSSPSITVGHNRLSPTANVLSTHAQTDKKVPLDLSCVKHEPSVTIS